MKDSHNLQREVNNIRNNVSSMVGLLAKNPKFMEVISNIIYFNPVTNLYFRSYYYN